MSEFKTIPVDADAAVVGHRRKQNLQWTDQSSVWDRGEYTTRCDEGDQTRSQDTGECDQQIKFHLITVLQ